MVNYNSSVVPVHLRVHWLLIVAEHIDCDRLNKEHIQIEFTREYYIPLDITHLYFLLTSKTK